MRMFRRHKRLVRNTIDRVVFGTDPLVPAMEGVYQQLVQRDLSRLQIGNDFYPLAGAANYGLLYVLLRAICNFHLKKWSS